MPRPALRRLTPIALAAAALSCGSGNGRVVASDSGAVEISVARPAFTLTATDGKPFDFRARTAGRLTFLQFGYTNCPDVCPVHLANLSAALRNLAPSDRMKIDVVFVSIDPDRDSLPALRKWLDAFDENFIGLTGSREALDAAQLAVHFGAATVTPEAPGSPGSEVVTHAAPVLAFTADDTAHVMFPFGTRQADWQRDLPHLLRRGSEAQATAASGSAPPGGAAGARSRDTPGPGDGMAVTRAYVVAPAGNAPAAAYFVIRNAAAAPDTLTGVDAGALGEASLHMTMGDASTGSTMMHAVSSVPVGAGETARLAPGGYHVMITLGRKISRGERVPIVLTFSRAGAVRLNATVITYADLDSAMAPR